jgi:hypothetical protein
MAVGVGTTQSQIEVEPVFALHRLRRTLGRPETERELTACVAMLA